MIGQLSPVLSSDWLKMKYQSYTIVVDRSQSSATDNLPIVDEYLNQTINLILTK